MQAVKASTLYYSATENSNKVSTVRVAFPHPEVPTNTESLYQDTEVAVPSSPHS